MNVQSVRAAVVVALAICLQAAAAFAMPDPPGRSTVQVARAERILVPQGLSAPKVLYPEGRVDFDVIESLVDAAIAGLTGKQGWQGWLEYVQPRDRIGLMIETDRYPVQVATVETIIDRLVGAGVRPSQILVFSGDERDLFAAGYSLSHRAGEVQVFGADSEGYRGGLSRIALDYCDAIINIGTLRYDPDFGMAGCVANALCALPSPQRVALRQDPALLAKAAGHPLLRQKVKLNLLEAYLPLLDGAGQNKVVYQYRGLLAGTDPVAVDTVGRRILQHCRDSHAKKPWPLPQAIDYLQVAHEQYRVGQSKPGMITVKLVGDEDDAFLQ